MNVDLPPDRPATMPAYVNIRQPDIYAEPKARLHRGRDGQPDIAVVYLADELDMHVRTAAQARALAATFTEAAELLDKVEGSQS